MQGQRGTENHTEQTALLRLSGRSITPLRPEQEEFLKALIQPDTKTISMSTGYIKDGTTHVTQGPLQGREKFIRRIDRHKRLAWLVLPAGDGQQELRTGLEIISKG